jgi:putative ABC transport system ATP-binding protein
MDIQPQTPALIEAHHLQFEVVGAAGRVNILRGVNLRIGASEVVGIVGPSGSGKTSLLMLLAGLDRASGGTLTVGGHALAGMNEDALARFRRDEVGIVFQSFHLVPTMTALENTALPLEFAGDVKAESRAQAALEAVGLGHRIHHYPGQLSGGEQQRVAVARAFVARPKLILADEPTGNLDRATGQAVMDLLFSLRESYGTTLVLITHDPALAARCDRQLRMEDGLLVEDFSEVPAE